MKKIEKNKSCTLKVLILNIVVMLLFTKAVNWHPFVDYKRVIGLVAVYGTMLIVIPLLAYLVKPITHLFECIFQYVSDCFAYLKNHYQRILVIVGMYLAVGILCVVIEQIYANFANTKYNVLITYSLIAVSYIALSTYLLRNDLDKKPEKLFLAIVMIVGSTFIMAEPNNIGVIWDEDSHFNGIIAICDFFDETGYEAEEKLYEVHAAVALELANYTEEERIAFDTYVNESFATREINIFRSRFGITSIAYIPSACAMMLGRALSLPFTWIFKLTKFAGLLLYGMIIYLGMKKLKFGKIIMATIGLMPTVLFMACNYSYDPWVIAWSLYGFAYFISFLQDRDKKVTRSDEIKMLGAFVIGLLPKATYFIMMLPLFLMPSTSFKNKKERQQYIVLVLISGLILALSFGLPFLIQGPGAGDTRGGSNVNATQQVAFILNNPGQFVEIMVNFLRIYLSLDYAGLYTQNFAYLGEGTFTTITTVVIFVTAFLDRSGEKSKDKWMCIVSYLGAFLAIFLAVLALYISYTPVGYGTVVGCQFRYIIPVLFIVLYMIGFDGVENKINRKVFNVFPMIFMVATLLLNVMLQLIQMY